MLAMSSILLLRRCYRGQNKKSVELEDEGTITPKANANAIALELLKMFRKRGPPSKLHNVIV